jgi:hypothetical protein
VPKTLFISMKRVIRSKLIIGKPPSKNVNQIGKKRELTTERQKLRFRK